MRESLHTETGPIKKLDKKEGKKGKSEKSNPVIKLTQKDLVEAGNVVGQDFTDLLVKDEKDQDDKKAA